MWGRGGTVVHDPRGGGNPKRGLEQVSSAQLHLDLLGMGIKLPKGSILVESRNSAHVSPVTCRYVTRRSGDSTWTDAGL
jgi:hypothetical protein